jgi:aminopeptidase N
MRHFLSAATTAISVAKTAAETTATTVVAIAALVALLTGPATRAQSPVNPLMAIDRAAAPMINDLVHTLLDVRFDYKKRYLYGKEWVTLKPHFNPTDTLRLDAKGMDIHAVSLSNGSSNIPLHYSYDGRSLAIRLDRVHRRNENYTVYIDYTAKPYEQKFDDSSLVRFNRGLYFVNPDSTEKDKPVQVYTQGETENSSAWFPTLDKPDQKSTDEIRMTVPSKYVTLSNGRLAAQHDNGDGTRTDTWKMELPQPPYLFMMAVGDFRIYHDHWRNIPVDYYLEPKYAQYSKEIFGVTPEIIEFFSKTLQYDFPWNKYDQVVVRDYASGGMENTTATLLNEYVQQTPRELLDAYYDRGRSTIVHELFHQWFGALVTCKSWSNQAVDETFAEFSDVLWAGYKYGRDEADAHRNEDLEGYLRSRSGHNRPIVRYHYTNELDMFDVVTYNKGNCVLNMLRSFLGDSAFFKGLSVYLKTNAFKNADVQQLRLALEEVSGIDLNWFFNQWYYSPGNPELDIHYDWSEATKTETVYVRQTQQNPPFRLPVAIDIYTGAEKQRHNVWVNDRADTLIFRLASKPDLVNFDGEKVLLAKITDHHSLDEYGFQYLHAPLYLDRLEAIDAALADLTDSGAQKILLAALRDKYYGLRITAIKGIDPKNEVLLAPAIPIFTDLAQTDSNTLARAAAITALGKLKRAEYLPIYNKALASPSYAVEGAALSAINLIDSARALSLAKSLEKESKGALTKAIAAIYAAQPKN